MRFPAKSPLCFPPMLERKAASLREVGPAPKLGETVLLFSTGSWALLASAQAAAFPQVPEGEAALRPQTSWEKGSGVGGWAGSGGRAGPGNLSTKASRMTSLQSCRGFLRGDRVGVCCWLVCLVHHRAEREETLSRFQEEHENLTPASRSLSPVQKYIPMETDRIPRWAVDLQFNEDGLHIFWFPLLQIKYTGSTKHSFSIFQCLGLLLTWGFIFFLF